MYLLYHWKSKMVTTVGHGLKWGTWKSSGKYSFLNDYLLSNLYELFPSKYYIGWWFIKFLFLSRTDIKTSITSLNTQFYWAKNTYEKIV